MLAAAVERSPFHARRLAGIDPGRFEPAQLADLPVMTKQQMMANFDELLTVTGDALMIRTVMVKVPNVPEYQVRQTDNGIDVAIIAEGALDHGALAESAPAPPFGVNFSRHGDSGALRRSV